MKKFSARLILLLGFTLWLGCGSDDPTDPDNNDPPVPDEHGIYDNVVNMDEEDVTMLGVSGSTYRFQVDGAAPQVRVGDIIVAEGDNSKGLVDKSMPDTFLRMVTGVVEEGGELVLETAEAAITDAVDSCDLTDLIDLPMGTPDYHLPGVTVTENGLSFSNVTLWDNEFIYYWNPYDPLNPIIGHLEARVMDGYITMETSALDWLCKIEGSEVTDFSSIYESRVSLGCDFYVRAIAELNWSLDSIELYKDTKRYTTWAGPFPIVHVITTSVSLEFDFSLGGEAEVTLEGLRAEFNVGSGGSFENDVWDYPNVSDMVLFVPEPELDGYVQLRVKPYAIIKVEDKFYGVGGPNIRAEPYVEVVTTLDPPQWCLDVDIGCDVGCGASLSILDDVLDLSWDSPGFNIFDADLFHECFPLLAAEEF